LINNIVDFEGKLYPGHVVHVKDNTVNVSEFHRSGIRNWKWPREIDAIDYKIEEIQQVA